MAFSLRKLLAHLPAAALKPYFEARHPLVAGSVDWDRPPDELYRALEYDGLGLERRVVFATGGAFTESAQRFLSTVRVPVLYKPFRAAALAELIEQSAAHEPRRHP